MALFYYKKSKEIKEFIKKISALDYYFVSVGSTGGSGKQRANVGNTHEFLGLIDSLGLRTHLDNSPVVGEMLYQVYDAEGTTLMKDGKFDKLRTHLLYAKLSDLKKNVANNAKIVCMAGGLAKLDALKGALNGKMFNVLITDFNTASLLIEDDTTPAAQ